MNELLDQITGLAVRERKRVFIWVGSLPEEKIIDIYQNGVKISYQIRNERPDLAGKIGKYCAFILAARQAGWDTLVGKGYRVARVNQFQDFSNLRKAKAAAFIRKSGRTPVLRKKVLAYLGEIKQLHEEGLGFRAIADYLHKCRKIKISATYLRMLWKEISHDASLL
jgi:hypothetical protein